MTSPWILPGPLDLSDRETRERVAQALEWGVQAEYGRRRAEKKRKQIEHFEALCQSEDVHKIDGVPFRWNGDSLMLLDRELLVERYPRSEELPVGLGYRVDYGRVTHIVGYGRPPYPARPFRKGDPIAKAAQGHAPKTLEELAANGATDE